MKKIFSVFVAFAIVFQLIAIPTANAQQTDFKDVPKNAFGYEEIMSLKERGYINGYLDGTYKPSALISRKHVMVLFDRSLDLKPVRKGIEFKDVPKNHAYYNEIQRMYRAGIVDGDINGRFNPDALLTRVQIAKILDLAFQFEPRTTIRFSDVHSGHWSEKHISTLHTHRIMTGTNGKFYPSNHVTRADYAVFLYRALEYREKHSHIGSSDDATYVQRVQRIQTKWNELKPTYTGPIMASEASVTAPYRLGSVHPQELNDALNITNFFRYLAYLPDNIQLNDAFSREAQAASVLMAANEHITHTPTKPANMDNSFFNFGYSGASSSNVAYGYKDIPDSIYRGYMSDASDSNRVRVGHRRWILSPHLKEVGFGHAYGRNGLGYTAMKVITSNMWDNPRASHDKISWPAETAFPADFFGANDPWSVSLNDEIYDAKKINQIRVVLTRTTDGKKWTFSKSQRADGFFNIDTDNYGQTPYTIIFQPKNTGEYKHDDAFHVEIQNVYKMNGQKENIQFETRFFNINHASA